MSHFSGLSRADSADETRNPGARTGVLDCNVERHDGAEQPDCVGQWCCGCAEHPIGKPWGWNFEAWERHYLHEHPGPHAASTEGRSCNTESPSPGSGEAEPS